MPTTRRRALPRVTSARALVLSALAAVLLLAACGSNGSGAGTGQSSPGASAAPTVVAVTYANGEVTPAPGRVKVPVGAHVRVKVTSDVADEVHNHVTDQEQAVTAGGTVTFDFVADRPGVFEIELHDADKVLLQLQVG